MIVDFLSPEDKRWSQFLSRTRHDFYHLPEYVKLAADEEGGRPVAFYANTGSASFLAPLLIQDIPASSGVPAGWLDAKSPYGYPMPLLVPSDDAVALQHFLDIFRQAAAKRGIISAFFRLHPLFTLPQRALVECGDLVRHGETVYIDLTLPAESIWRATRENHRRDINKLNRTGFHAVLNRWEFYREFIEIYEQTVARLNADISYFFSDAYFSGLRKALGSRLHLCAVLSPEGDVVAAGLFTTVHGIVQYHLGGTRAEYYHLSPAKLMFDTVWRWAKENGHSTFHLGGGVGCRMDSLFNFKAGFSKQRAVYYTYRMILGEERYSTLVDRWQQLGGSLDEETDFFPIYRLPL